MTKLKRIGNTVVATRGSLAFRVFIAIGTVTLLLLTVTIQIMKVV